MRVKWEEKFEIFLSSDVTLSDLSHCVFHMKLNEVAGEIWNGKTELSHSVIFYNVIMLAILSKSIAIIDSDTAEKSIADSDSDTQKHRR